MKTCDRFGVLLCCVLLMACDGGKNMANDDKVVDKAARDELSRDNDHADPEGVAEAERTVRGTLVIDAVATRGKPFQGVWLIEDDDQTWLLAYRPREKFFPFHEKRVVVTGRPYAPPPHAQQIMADHFGLEEIELAEDEEPYDPVPDVIPTPPLVRELDDFDETVRWAAVVGELSDLKEGDDGSWFEATLTLSDGTELPVEYLARSQAREGMHTLMTIPQRTDDGWKIVSPTRLCPGERPRCAMPPE